MKVRALRFLTLALLMLGSGTARSATLTWINAAGGDWNNTNNWSPNQVPATGDSVIITQNGTYTVTNGNSATLANLTLGGSVGSQTLNIASLTLNNSGTVNSNGVLNWSGGDLEGALTVEQGATLSLSNTVYFDSTSPYTNTATLTNYGTVIWVGNITSYANVNNTGGSATIENAGLWESVADNTISLAGGNATGLFLNTGTLEKIGGAGTSAVNWNYENNGGIVTTLTGAFSMGNWTGNGLVHGNAAFSGGTINGTLSPGAVMNISGATIYGPLIISSNAALNWNGGDLEGALTVAQGGTLSLSNTVYVDSTSPYTNTAALTNYGTVIWAGNITSDANINNTGGSATIDNAGLWESVADNTMSLAGGNVTGLFLNTGTLEKIGGTGTSAINWNYENNGGSITTSGGAFSMANWRSSGLVYGNATFSGGTFSGTLVPGTVINISGATIAGSVNVSSNAILNWNGGDLEGALMVAQGGTLSLSNTVYVDSTSPYTNTATLTNYGTVIWAGAIASYANINNTGGSATIDNAGLWESVADNTMSLAGGNAIGLFLNTGTLEKIGGAGTSTINWGFNNNGGSVTTSSGAFSMGDWTGSGLVYGNAAFSGGTLTGTLVPGAVINASGATIVSSLIISSNAVLNWSGGNLEGSLTVAPGGTLSISNTVYFDENYPYTNTVTLVNYGTVIWAGTIASYANINNTGGSATIENAGLWESVADNAMSLAGGNATGLFINTGTLEKIGGTGTSTINWNFENNGGTLDTSVGYLTFSVNWTGSGLVYGNAVVSGYIVGVIASNAVISWIGGDLEGALTVAQGGTLSITNTVYFDVNSPYTNTATLTNYGTVIWGGTINSYANYNNTGGSATIDNAGLWECVADNSMSLVSGNAAGRFLNTGTLEKIGGTGTSTVNWNFENNGGTLDTSVGYLTFSVNWTGSGLVYGNAVVSGYIVGVIASNAVISWIGGDLEGALTVAQGGTLSITNTVYFDVNSPYTNTATLTNYGTVIWGGTINSYANYNNTGGSATIDNAGLWESVADNAMSLAGGNATGLFINTGTLEKIGGTGASTINWNFTNGGTVLAVDGTVAFGGGLNLTNGLLDFAVSGPSSFGRISVSGTANLAGGVGAILLNGYVPTVGTQFNVMTFGSSSGAFTDYSGLNAGGGIVFNPTLSPTTLTLQTAATNYLGVKPFIVVQPVGQTVNYNGTVTLSVVVSGSTPLTFQWKQNNAPVPVGTNATLTLTNVLVSQAGQYTVLVTNSAGGAISQPVTLTVYEPYPW